LLGQGVVGNDVPLPPGSPFLSHLPSHEQDLDRARRLIAESGVGPIALELYTSSERPPAPKLAVAFAEAASRIGVKITIRDVPYTEYVANVSRKKPFYTSQWIAGATLYDSLYLKYHSGASYNYSKREQAPGLDAILEQMISEVDAQKRKAIVAVALAKIQQSSDRIIPYFLNYIGASAKKLQGFKPPSYGPFDVTDLWFDA
jgi:peptide/nickel transport system substrate-binding protein